MSAPRGSRRAWNALPFNGPAPKSCYNHSCVVTNKSTLMMLGGETITCPTPLSDLHSYRSRQWALTTRHNAPPGLSAHSSVAWGAKMMTFGGRTSSGLSNDLHTYNEETTSWSRARQNGDVPTAREFHSLSLVALRLPDGGFISPDSNAQALVVFGGITSDGLDDGVYVMPLDSVDMRWRKVSFVSEAPIARSHHCAAVIGSKLFIFGGKTASGEVLDDLWVLDFSGDAITAAQVAKPTGETCVWPTARYYHAATSTSAHPLFIMIGGKNGEEKAADELIWTYDAAKSCWASVPLELEPPRYGHTLCMLSPLKLCLLGGVAIQDSDTTSDNAGHIDAYTRIFQFGEDSPSSGPTEQLEEMPEIRKPRKRGDSIRKSGDKKGTARKNKKFSPRQLVNAPSDSVNASQEPSNPSATSHSIDNNASSAPSETAETDAQDATVATEQFETASPRNVDSSSEENNPEDIATNNATETQEPQNDVSTPSPDSAVQDHPVETKPSTAEDVAFTNASTNYTADSDASAASDTQVETVSPAAFTSSPMASPLPAAVANLKKPATRARSARVSASGTAVGWIPMKPGNAEWIDLMDVDQLRNELKTMTSFVYAVKSLVEAPGEAAQQQQQQQTAESQLAAIKAHFAENLPKFTQPTTAQVTLVPGGSVVVPKSPAQTVSTSVASAVTSMASGNGNSSDAAVTSSSPGSGKIWGGASSPKVTPALSGSVRDHMSLDSVLTIGHRGSVIIGSASALGMESPKSGRLTTSGSSIPVVLSSSPPASAPLSPSSSSSDVRRSIYVKEFDSSSTAEKQAQMLESQMDGSQVPTTSCPDNDQTRRDRQYVVRELLETEKNYVRDLKIIIEEFQDPLASSGVLNAKQIFEVFSNVKAFVPLHEQLLDNLSATIEKPDAEQCPGQIFLAMADYLKMYTGFCASQTGIAQKISDLSKSNSAFRKFLDAKLKDPKCRGLTLTGFLVMPIQRVCRFPLLLKQIAKSTPVTHSDFKNLHLGIFKVDKVVMAVNEGKRTIEAQAQMFEIDQTLTWEKKPPTNFVFMDPSRRLLATENIELFSGGKHEPLQLLIFNDLVLLTKNKDIAGGTQTARKVRRAYALATTTVGLDDQLDTSTGKPTLQIGFLDETLNLAFASKEKRAEIQHLIAEAKTKLPDSATVRETIELLESYQ